MSNFEVDFNFFKLGFWSTVILGIAQLAGWININVWLIFLPFIIAIGGYFIIIFLIGLITLYFVDKELNKNDGDSEKEETIE